MYTYLYLILLSHYFLLRKFDYNSKVVNRNPVYDLPDRDVTPSALRPIVCVLVVGDGDRLVKPVPGFAK